VRLVRRSREPNQRLAEGLPSPCSGVFLLSAHSLSESGGRSASWMPPKESKSSIALGVDAGFEQHADGRTIGWSTLQEGYAATSTR